MRRPLLLGSLFLGLIVIILAALLIQAFRQATPGNIARTHEQETRTADFLTIYAPGGITGVVPSPLPSPTLDLTNLPATAAAYGTTYADAGGEVRIAIEPDIGMVSHVTITETDLNALIEPYAAELGDISNIVLDLMPGSASIDADLKVIGIPIHISTTGLITLENNMISLDVTDATMGGMRPPQAGIDSVQEEVIPLVYSAIMDGLAVYAARDAITLVALEVTDTSMIVGYIFATPVPTATPES